MNAVAETRDDRSLLDGYLTVLNTLSLELKMQLVARLTTAISEEFVAKKTTADSMDPVDRLYGAWKSDETAEETVAKIRSARRNSTRVVEF